MRLRRIIAPVLLVALGGAVVLELARRRTIRVPEEARLVTWSVDPYRDVLAAGVQDGLVDYAALTGDRRAQLDRSLEALGRFGPRSTPDLFATDDDRLAYYLNAYNAIMIGRWLDAGAGAAAGRHRTVNTAWFFFDRWRVDGRWTTLHALEQKLIRPTFGDARVHFALVCGALSCPPLLGEPFDGARLDAQLDALARRWLLEPDGLRVDGDGTVTVSRIFEWYAEDFEAAGGLPGVFERSLDVDDARRDVAIAAAREGRVGYQPYDWTINDARLAGRPDGIAPP